MVSNHKSIASSNRKKLTYENRLDAAEVDQLSKHEKEAKTTTVQVQIARLINLLTTSEQIQIEDQLRKDIAIVEGHVADLSLPALKKEVTHEQRNQITKLAAMMSSPSQLLARMHGTAPAPGATVIPGCCTPLLALTPGLGAAGMWSSSCNRYSYTCPRCSAPLVGRYVHLVNLLGSGVTLEEVLVGTPTPICNRILRGGRAITDGVGTGAVTESA